MKDKNSNNFNKEMKEHYREVLNSAEEYKQCLNPEFSKELLPEEIAWMSLSTLNPFLHVKLKEGQIVLDIGCGAGADCFLAAELVGKDGKVIGVDPVEELIKKAKNLKKKYNYNNVEFKVCYGEQISLKKNYFDLVIMNYSFHLVKEKKKLLNKIHKILNLEGVLVIADFFDFSEVSFEENPKQWFYKAGGSIPPGKAKKIASEIGFKKIRYTKEKNKGEQIGYMIMKK